MIKPSSPSRAMLAAVAIATAMTLLLASGSAKAVQNNGGGNDMGSACTFVDAHRYYCVFDNGQSYICTTNYPKGPEECTPALKKNTNRIPKGSIGRPLKAN